MTALLVADSFLVDDGRVRGLSLHRARFTASCAAHGIEAGGFFDAVIAELPREGRWFPRLELSAGKGLGTGAEPELVTGEASALGAELGSRLRPAPEYGGPVAVLPYDRPDPRRQPRVKGPDLELLGALRDRAAASDGAGEVLLCGRAGEVLEGAYTSLLWWEDGPSAGAAVHAAGWQRLLTDLAEPLPA